MRNILVLLRKDMRIFLHDRISLGISFLAPAILILIFGWIFGGSGGGSETNIRLMIVDEANSDASHALLKAFEREPNLNVVSTFSADDGSEQPLTEELVRQRIQENASQWRHALILPADLISSDEFGFHIRLIQNRQYQSESSLVEGLVQKTLFTNGFKLLIDAQMKMADDAFGAGTVDTFYDRLAGLIGSSFNGDPAAIRNQLADNNYFGALSDSQSGENGDSAQNEDLAASMLKVDREQLFGESKSPVVQSVGGWAIMFLLFSVSGFSAGLLSDKHDGIYLRLLSGPVTRTQVLWSKYLFLALVGFIQLCALFAFGEIFFGIFTAEQQLLPIAIVNAAACLAGGAMGMLIVSLCKTESQAGAISTMIILPVAAFGGAMFPVFMLPPFIQQFIAPLTPVYWALDGYYAVLWRDQGLPGILQPCAVLLLFAAVLLPFAIWRFRKGDLFR